MSGQINAEMNSENDDSDIDDDEKDAKTGRDLFRQKVTNRNVFFNNGYGSEDDSEASESDDESDDDGHEQ